MVWYFICVNIINTTLHGRLQRFRQYTYNLGKQHYIKIKSCNAKRRGQRGRQENQKV